MEVDGSCSWWHHLLLSCRVAADGLPVCLIRQLFQSLWLLAHSSRMGAEKILAQIRAKWERYAGHTWRLTTRSSESMPADPETNYYTDIQYCTPKTFDFTRQAYSKFY